AHPSAELLAHGMSLEPVHGIPGAATAVDRAARSRGFFPARPRLLRPRPSRRGGLNMPIRVLHVITRLIVGGAQENTLLTVEGLHRRREYDVALMVGADDGPEGEILTRARGGGFPLIEVPELVRSLHPVK